MTPATSVQGRAPRADAPGRAPRAETQGHAPRAETQTEKAPRRRVFGPMALAILGLVVLSLASLAIGAARLDLAADPARALMILWESRLPRTLAVLLAGSALAVAGLVMQQIVQNRFVEPGTIGTAESAALGLLAVTILAPGAPIWVKMLVASGAALAGTALFLALIRRLPRHEVFLVPLAGLVLGGILQAAVTFIAWETDLVQMVAAWLMTGEFSGVLAGRYELLWAAGLAAGLAWFAADRFAILGLGEGVARGLGLSPDHVMRLGLAVVSVSTAMVVVTVGMVPFVGLVVPNIVARLVGDNLRRAIPLVALGGAGLVLACDLIARLLIHPYEIPVGMVLGILGSGLFLYLLWRRPAHG